MKKVIYDIETFKDVFLYCDMDVNSKEKNEFEISCRKNDLHSFVKYLKESNIDYAIGYNNLNFDAQVIQYILDENEKWYDLTWKEVVSLIYNFAQEIISNQDYELPPPYREKFLDIKQIDLYELHHFSNKNRRTSLKWVEYSTDMEVEELPLHHSKEGLSIEDLDNISLYCWNDITATHTLYLYSIGETEHKLYKGKNKLQLREDLQKEFGFDHTCLSWNDVKIGDELNKKNYCELAKVDSKKIWELKRQRKSKTSFTFGDCFPDYWKFDTPEFQKVFAGISKTKVNLNEKQEFKFTYNNTTYIAAKGGAHSVDLPRIIKPCDKYIIKDCDISSMYPNAIRKRVLFPAYLGKKWNEAYVSNIPKRIEAKKKFKETKDKRYENFSETYKLVMNGNFGRLIDRYNWQYDAFTGMCVTIGSQIDIFMLVEDLEVAGIEVLSLNTDGVVCKVPRDKETLYYEVCKKWEEQVGNDILGNLEYTDYELLVQTSVNDYIAVKIGDEPLEERIKQKGDFCEFFELHKNKSRRVIPVAITKYFTEGIPIEETIKNHKNIFDFCIGAKATRQFHYEGVDKATGKKNIYNKLIRYYVSTEGEKLYKVKNEEAEDDTKAPKIRECEADIPYQTLFNRAWFPEKFDDYKISYDYYINKANAIISKLEPKPKTLKNQLTLF